MCITRKKGRKQTHTQTIQLYTFWNQMQYATIAQNNSSTFIENRSIEQPIEGIVLHILVVLYSIVHNVYGEGATCE